jgi:hypothetical protein
MLVVPAGLAAASIACDTPAAPLKLTVTVAEAPAAMFIGVFTPDTVKAEAPAPETFSDWSDTVFALVF